MDTAGDRTATIGARGQHRRPKDGVACASYADLNASPMMEVSTMKRSCPAKNSIRRQPDWRLTFDAADDSDPICTENLTARDDAKDLVLIGARSRIRARGALEPTY